MSLPEPSDEDIEIRGRMDIEDIVKYQINRCNISATDPNPKIFESNVLTCLDLLPAHKRKNVLENTKAYGDEQDVEEYDMWAGIQLIDTKRVVKKFITDYHKLYRVILDAFADSGLTWKVEEELVERGKVEVVTKPTPYFPHGDPNE